MKKHTAIWLLGGDIVKAAQAIGCTKQAVHKWDTDEFGNLTSKPVWDACLAAMVRLYAEGKLPDFDEATRADILTPPPFYVMKEDSERQAA